MRKKDKLCYYLKLSEQTALGLTSSIKKWKEFLRFAGWLYKYPYPDQVLIYAQRPDATAVAPLKIWNRSMHRWVNMGAKGIGLLQETGGRLSVRYCFDVSDTHPGRYRSRTPVPWKITSQDDAAVLSALYNSFDKVYDNEKGFFADQLCSIARVAVKNGLPEYMEKLQSVKQGSFLEELDDLNLEERLKQTAANSTAYLVLSRCGFPADEYFFDEDFQFLCDFSTQQSMGVLGNAVSDISEQLLRQVEYTIKMEERKREANEYRRRNGHDLPAGGRRSAPEFGDTGRGSEAGGEIRQDLSEIPQGAQKARLQSVSLMRGADEESTGSGTRSPVSGRDNHKADGKGTGRERGTESQRSDEMGGTDEQHQALSGGDRSKRPNLQLSLFPKEKPKYQTQAESKMLSAFSVSQKDLDAELQHGTGVEGGKFRIYAFYQQEPNSKTAIAFLKEEYGYSGHSHTFLDGTNGFVNYQASKGIKFSREHQEAKFTWNVIEQRIRQLVADEEYLTDTEKMQYEELEQSNNDDDIPKPQPQNDVPVPPTQTSHSEQEREENLDKIDPVDIRRDESGAELFTQEPETKNFRITDSHLGEGGAKAKYGYNISAIRTLQTIETESRSATPEEQDTLSRYVGWGGIPQVFDPDNASWAKEYTELKELLTSEEYDMARASTLNAHYTSPTVIQAMYEALGNLEFKTGNLLEPSCGIGNFMGLLPERMADSHFYGVELDSVTGRIARQLYPKNHITIKGFEDVDFSDNFFDCAIGNVPFGQYKVADKRYDKHNFLIHDYFFAKTLDKVRPGGIIAFITSKGTMDKENTAVRRYIAQRADLLGAIRLPNNAFLTNARTKVTSDILFLQKRDHITDLTPDWVHLEEDQHSLKINRYFTSNPEMVLGEMTTESTQYGHDTTCCPIPGAILEEQLRTAIGHIHGKITAYDREETEDTEDYLPADPTVRNFSFTAVDGKLYFRENSMMKPVSVSATAEKRIHGLIELRNCVRTLIEYQTEDYSREDIQEQQQQLNALYDAFIKKFGRISKRGNQLAFSEDSSYYLLCSLEVFDEEGNFKRKADMFTKRTIKQRRVITSVDTASEALTVSMSEKARVDMDYMAQLTGKTPQEIETELTGVIFRLPSVTNEDGKPQFVAADEYLSGNVRMKLEEAQTAATDDSAFFPNVKALEAVQPKPLTASEINVRLGATWLPADVVQEFIMEFLSPSPYARRRLNVVYSDYTAQWVIEGKNNDRGNIKAHSAYGSERINAYKIIENTLNLRDVRIFDYVTDENGNQKPVFNKKETTIAQQKQELIKTGFADWIWQDPARRERLCNLYNERFNSVRPRAYDGRHLSFPGMNPEITLYPHQLNAIAHILYGGNTLLAHVVGAGKTFEMVAAAMESKRLGLCQKPLFVVPNHLTEQWASDFLQLYPAANILVAKKKDFETKNRKKFCGRIATGDYDAIIIGHSQFEKIPMSVERQKKLLEQEIEEVTSGIADLKRNHSENFTVKQLARTKKSLQVKLKKLNDPSQKDDVVTFEELGVDRIFVDEAHYYKNLFLYTKMRNVGGIAQTEAKKSSDLFAKCQYLDELTGGRGVVFATGTPISNSMVELYTMQRYLQYATLKHSGLQNFDAWASTFGETVTAIELAPEGTGYRAKTRFSRFYNLPELMGMFRDVADIQTADMLNLPVPKANFHTIALKPSDQQREIVASLAVRAERVRNRMVEPNEDNMLLITNDGRKLALDQRLVNPLLPDFKGSKVNACANQVFTIWERTKESSSTQLVFCDLSTPKNDGSFNVYNDIREKLIEKGVPAEEIAFIHNANTEKKKDELFAKVRSGTVRVLLGSTQKMGAGTNVQSKLIAIHDLDCPWRPSDLEQRSGRIIRQGNENPEVDIYRYVTENTFDAYLFQLVENKQKFISQIMTSKSPVRSAEDIDEASLSYAEIKALAAGNPHIKEKMDLDIAVARLKVLKSNFLSQKYALEDKILKRFPLEIAEFKGRIEGVQKDIQYLKENTYPNEEGFSPMVIDGHTYSEKESAGKALLRACKKMKSPEPVKIGTYRGFTMELFFDGFSKRFQLSLKNALRHKVELGDSVYGNLTRMDHVLEDFPNDLKTEQEHLENAQEQLKNAKLEVQKPFAQELELKIKTARLAELDTELNLARDEPEQKNEEEEFER